MAMDPITFLGLWAFAVLATLGTITTRVDDETRVFSAFLAGLVWFVYAFSALDIQPHETGASEAYEPLFWLGIVLGALLVIVGVFKTFKLFKR